MATTFTWTFILESLNHLTIISIDRMVAVVYPFKYRVYSQTSAVNWFVGLTWCLSLLEGALSGVSVFARKHASFFTGDVLLCSASAVFTNREHLFHLYTWIRFALAFVILLANYVLIVFSHRKHVKMVAPVLSISAKTSGSLQKQESIESNNSSDSAMAALYTLRKREGDAAAAKTWKLARFSLFAVLGVTLCFLPRMVYHFSESVGVVMNYPSTYHGFSFFMISLNSAINPFIYTNCVPELRQIWTKVGKIVKEKLSLC